MFLIQLVILNDCSNSHLTQCKCLVNWLIDTGPVVAALSNKFGCRAVAMAGSLIASISFVVSCFAHTIDMILVTYGFLGGQSTVVFPHGLPLLLIT